MAKDVQREKSMLGTSETPPLLKCANVAQKMSRRAFWNADDAQKSDEER